MDEFVLDAAKEMNVDMSKYGYPDDLNGFKRVTKSEDASENPKLRQLFGQIKDYPELVAFRNTLKYLVNQKYDADTEIAKQFFDGRLKTEDLMQYLK